jgi:hypothetical protein
VVPAARFDAAASQPAAPDARLAILAVSGVVARDWETVGGWCLEGGPVVRVAAVSSAVHEARIALDLEREKADPRVKYWVHEPTRGSAPAADAAGATGQ